MLLFDISRWTSFSTLEQLSLHTVFWISNSVLQVDENMCDEMTVPQRVLFWWRSCCVCMRPWGLWAMENDWSSVCLCKPSDHWSKPPAWCQHHPDPYRDTQRDRTKDHRSNVNKICRFQRAMTSWGNRAELSRAFDGPHLRVGHSDVS